MIEINEDGLTIINDKYGPIKPSGTYYAKACCGCCTIRMCFHSKENVVRAFRKAGLDVAATIRDDSGIYHQEVNTFYGFTESETEQKERSLGYLISLIP